MDAPSFTAQFALWPVMSAESFGVIYVKAEVVHFTFIVSDEFMSSSLQSHVVWMRRRPNKALETIGVGVFFLFHKI
jgi:hypothetical protein